MDLNFDPGPYGAYATAFLGLMNEFPIEKEVYSPTEFFTEWGPIFYRGRLDGTAKGLVIGHDPAYHEAVARRILVGHAGKRTQGFLQKLGFTKGYVAINTFIYSVVFNKGGMDGVEDVHPETNAPGIQSYRNRWLNAIFEHNRIEVVLNLGPTPEAAFQAWETSDGQPYAGSYTAATIIHPTMPERYHGTAYAQKINEMLGQWNETLKVVVPKVRNPDIPGGSYTPYGDNFAADGSEEPDIPAYDMPAGLPEWMRGGEQWAWRGTDPEVSQMLGCLDPRFAGGNSGDTPSGPVAGDASAEGEDSLRQAIEQAIQDNNRLRPGATPDDIRRAVLTVVVPGKYWAWKDEP